MFSGQTHWLDLQMFYPYTNTLGYSDTFVIFGTSHALFRLIGFDMYLANSLNYLFWATLAFIGFFLLMRRVVQLSLVPAALGSGLFICFSPVVSGAFFSHPQLYNTFLVPWFLLMLFKVLGNFRQGNTKLSLSHWLLPPLLALGLLNGFYMAWFFLFFCALFFFCSMPPANAYDLVLSQLALGNGISC